MSYEQPENTEDTLYLSWRYTLEGVIDAAQDKWPDIKFDEIDIESHRIKTSGCACHDDYDDFENFIVLTASKEYFDRIKT